MPPPSTRWYVVDPSALAVRHWDGENEHVVFHVASGDLHLLNSAAIAVLDHLTASAATLDDLSWTLESPNRDALGDVLESLDRLGLINPLLS